jgi:hypothetical protein
VTSRRFPLVDVILGSRGVYLGAPALLAHGIVLDAYRDEACTVPASVYTLDGTPSDGVTVSGSTLPPFLGPLDGVGVLYLRQRGGTGSGRMVLAADLTAAPIPGDTPPDLAAHVAAMEPHPAYDDLPSLSLLLENGLI